MKYRSLLWTGIMISAAAGTALGDGRVTMNYADAPYSGGSPGGGFKATKVSGYLGSLGGPGGSWNSFTTFCIEYDEHFSPGSTYYARISHEADGGGSGGPSPDDLSSRTAIMYQRFREGASIGGYVVDTYAEVTELQNALWSSEEELERPYAGLSAMAKAMYDWAEEATDNDGISDVAAFSSGKLGKVRVMQLWNDAAYTNNAQDMLTMIPLPTTAGLASLGLMGIVIPRRRVV